jgi:hypothetical protein
MINCYISSLCALCSQLMLEQLARDDYCAKPDEPISDAEEERISGWLEIAANLANDFEWRAVHDRIAIIKHNLLKTTMSQRDLATELRVLRETIHDGLREQHIYRYPQDKSKILRKWKDDWAQVRSSFPSAEKDIIASVDLWALGHSTASVFHFMRVAEHGLHAIARERRVKLPKNKPIEWAAWQEIIKSIGDAQTEIGKTKPPGPGKDEALAFYSGAIAHLEGFKDKYRNLVAHVRKDYDEHQAASAMMHVREFMIGLSAKIGENPKPIRWKFR